MDSEKIEIAKIWFLSRSTSHEYRYLRNQNSFRNEEWEMT